MTLECLLIDLVSEREGGPRLGRRRGEAVLKGRFAACCGPLSSLGLALRDCLCSLSRWTCFASHQPNHYSADRSLTFSPFLPSVSKSMPPASPRLRALQQPRPAPPPQVPLAPRPRPPLTPKRARLRSERPFLPSLVRLDSSLASFEVALLTTDVTTCSHSLHRRRVDPRRDQDAQGERRDVRACRNYSRYGC